MSLPAYDSRSPAPAGFAGGESAILLGIMLRFWVGMAGAVVAGCLAFGGAVFQPESLQFQTLTIGALAAGIVTLVRVRHAGTAAVVAVAYGGLALALGRPPSIRAGIGGVLVGAGVLLSAIVFHELSRAGFRFGKFLVLGSLIGGAYLAVAPLLEFSNLGMTHAAGRVVSYGVLGIVIGNGVGFGIEIAELMPSVGAIER